jgi:hypothetical protein
LDVADGSLPLTAMRDDPATPYGESSSWPDWDIEHLVDKLCRGFPGKSRAAIKRLSCLQGDNSSFRWAREAHRSREKKPVALSQSRANGATGYAFDNEIENEAFTGSPTIVVTRVTEENDVVFAEEWVRAQRKDGGVLHAVFCDAFEMENGKIRKLTSYLME